MNFEFIKPSDLKSWSHHPDMASFLPTWIDALVKAEGVGNIIECNFKKGEAAAKQGYDGRTNLSAFVLNIPAGESYWELGKTSAVRDKASSEFDDTAKDLGKHAKNANFIFVTPHEFPRVTKKNKKFGERFFEETREDWVSERKSEKKFLDVRVIDQDILTDWTNRHPVIAVDVATKFGKPIDLLGFTLPDSVVRKYVGRFESDLITPEILILGRSETTGYISAQFNHPDVRKIAAANLEEAIAFACYAYCGQAGQKIRRTKTLVIENPETIRRFSSYEGYTFILPVDLERDIHELKQKNNIIICSAISWDNISDKHSLRTPGRDRLEKYLKEVGLTETRVLSTMAGGSSSSLARIVSGTKSIPPEYEGFPEDANEDLLLAALLGGWDSETQYFQGSTHQHPDLALIESHLVQGTYPEFERKLERTTDDVGNKKDSLLKKKGDMFWVKAPIDALDILLPQLKPRHFDALQDMLIDVFSGKFEQTPDEADVFEQGLLHSENLKKGVALTFCIIANRGVQTDKQYKDKPLIHWAEDTFMKLTQAVDFTKFISSRDGLLRLFAEAVPSGFIQALRNTLQGDKDGLTKILTLEANEYWLWERNYAVNILWALERLAWIPEYYEDVLKILIQMHILDPDKDANSHPRPSSVFNSINIGFAPQTSVTSSERLLIIKKLAGLYPEEIFPLIVDVLPEDRGFVSTNSKPIFFNTERPAQTWKEFYDYNDGLFDIAIELAGSDAEKISKIIECLPQYSDQKYDSLIANWAQLSFKMEDAERTLIWQASRSLYVRHSIYPDADWSMGEKRCAKLKLFSEKFQPSEDALLELLFSETYPQYFMEEDDFSGTQLKSMRIDKIGGQIRAGNLSKLVNLRNDVKEPGTLGIIMAEAINNLDEVLEIIKSLKDDELPSYFVRGLSIGQFDIDESWAGPLIAALSKNPNSKSLFEALLALPVDKKIYQELTSSSLSKKTIEKYWTNIPINSWTTKSLSDEIIERLFQAGRHADILSAMRYRVDSLSDDVLITLARGFYESIENKDPDTINGSYFDSLMNLLGVVKQKELLPEIELAKYEYPLAKNFRFGHNKYPFAIHSVATRDPEHFVEILSYQYKSEHRVELDHNWSEEALSFRAQNSFSVFNTMVHPSLQAGGVVSTNELLTWIEGIKTEAAKFDLVSKAMYYVGEVLSQCSSDDEDSIWPRSEVRGVIEALQNDRLEKGFRIRCFNERGTFSDGYSHYNSYADKYEDNAKELDRWPRTQALLLQMEARDRRRAESSRIEDEKRDEQNWL